MILSRTHFVPIIVITFLALTTLIPLSTDAAGNDSYTELLLSFDGVDEATTYTPDESSNNLDIQADNTGDTKIDTAQAKFGASSLSLRSTIAYTYVNANGSALALGSGDFAIDFWMRMENVISGTTYGYLYDGRPAATEGAYPEIYALDEGGGATRLKYRVNSVVQIDGTTALSADTWYHVAVTRVNGTTRLFLNGVQEGSNYSDANTYLGSNLRPIIGADHNGSNSIGRVTGGAWMDEVRVSIGNGRWSSNFTPPTSEYSTSNSGTLSKPPNNLGLVGYWSFDDATSTVATDFSGNGNHGTFQNDPTWIAGKRGRALNFANGSNDHLALGTSFDVSSLPISFAAWIRLDPAGANAHRAIINKRDTFANGDMRFHWHVNSENSISLEHPTGGEVFENYILPFDTWIHVATVATSTGSALYINGALVELGGVYSLGTDAAAQVYIGSNPDTDAFIGDMDELRVYNRELGASEIAALARAGAVRFTSNSKTLTQGSSLQSGLIGLWTFDGADTRWTSGTAGLAYDRSGSNNTGTLTNMNQKTSVDGGVLGQVLNFNGSNSYVDTANAVSTAPATACAWVKYATNSSAFSTILSTGNRFRFFVINGGGNTDNIQIYNNVGAVDSASDTVRANVWNHVCAYIDAGNDAAIYINGALSAGPEDIGGGTASEALDIGSEGGSNTLSGSIDDVRYYNRILTGAEIKQLYNLGKAKIVQ